MKSSTGPLYKNIALDIANRIVRGKLKSDEKISGRSTLASMYNVSPETIRRAIALLEDMDVVVSNKGSGIEILSISAAEKFIERNKNNVYLKTVKENIVDILAQRRKLDKELEDNFNKILDLVERFENISPFTLIEIDIKEHCKFIGKKVNEVKFWQKTKATIVAFRRRDDIIISPGPEYIFTKGDILVVIGSKNVYNEVHKFLYE